MDIEEIPEDLFDEIDGPSPLDALPEKLASAEQYRTWHPSMSLDRMIATRRTQ